MRAVMSNVLRIINSFMGSTENPMSRHGLNAVTDFFGVGITEFTFQLGSSQGSQVILQQVARLRFESPVFVTFLCIKFNGFNNIATMLIDPGISIVTQLTLSGAKSIQHTNIAVLILDKGRGQGVNKNRKEFQIGFTAVKPEFIFGIVVCYVKTSCKIAQYRCFV